MTLWILYSLLLVILKQQQWNVILQALMTCTCWNASPNSSHRTYYKARNLKLMSLQAHVSELLTIISVVQPTEIIESTVFT